MTKKDFKTWDGAIVIPIDKLILCDWNCNVMADEEFAALCLEIKDGGFDEPCQVVPVKDDKYLVLGGEHRVRGAVANGFKELPCVIKKHLTGAEEKDLIIWSVRRNDIRGKIDAQKYAALEQRLDKKWGVAAEAARREMLIKGDLLKNLRRSPALEDNESLELSNDDDDLLDSDGSPNDSKNDSDGKKSKGERSATDGEHDTKKKFADRRALLQALKSAEQEVLLQSEDTVEHNYLFFTQNGGQHLVVDESAKLHELVAEMVNILKRNSEKVDDFLVSAISKELASWR
jgi:ParB-like chromosome segregation protein Spo0J